MLLSDLAGKTVCILGFGREGKAMLGAIEDAGITCEITVADANAELQVASYKLQVGEEYLKGLDVFDVIIASPGVRPCSELDAVADRVTTSTQIFLDEASAIGATVIGVTGSKGKSTVSSLLYAILQQGRKDALLLGNIGTAAIGSLKKIKENTIVVHELSSAQLARMKSSPSIAVITAFFPEHLDYHGSLEKYREAKEQIVKYQTADDRVYVNADDSDALAIAKHSAGTIIEVHQADAPVKIEDTQLIGAHNLTNIALAYKTAIDLGVDDASAIATITSFHGLPHRLERIGTHHGINWVNDSIATTPEATIAALNALGDNVETLILGGQDRGFTYDALCKRIDASAIKTVILFPETGTHIKEALTRDDIKIHEVTAMNDAVALAKNETREGKTCLLSPAAPSYNRYKNFEERGEAFRSAIVAGGGA